MAADTITWESHARFDDPHNITANGARLIYAKACHPIGRDPLPEGWVVPGGARITDQWEAMAAAVRLGELMGRNGA